MRAVAAWPDVTVDPRFRWVRGFDIAGLHAMLSMPLVWHEQVVGVLDLRELRGAGEERMRAGDHVHVPALPPNEPGLSRQWGLTRIGAPIAWAAGARGSGVTIAIVTSNSEANVRRLLGPELVGRPHHRRDQPVLHRPGSDLGSRPVTELGQHVGDVTFDWQPRDIFVVPSWAPVAHAAVIRR